MDCLLHFRRMISIDLDGSTPYVTQIEAKLRRKIEDGFLRGGAKMHSVRMLARECGVSAPTVVEAYNRLVSDGYLEARRGSGYFVSSRRRGNQGLPAICPGDVPVDSMWMLLRVFEEVPFDIRAGASGVPTEWLFADGVKAGLRAASRLAGLPLVSYGTPRGYLPLRQLLQSRLGDCGIDVNSEQIVLANGASHALTIAIRVLTRPGDTVLVDDPGYCNLLSSLRQHDLNLVGVPRTVTGPDTEAFARLVTEHRPKAFFTNGCLQNPTGTSYAASTAHRILQIADQNDLYVVEDDALGDFSDPPALTLAGIDGLRRVIYVRSFSKTTSPGFRVGYLLCPAELVDRFVQRKMLDGLTTSELTERIVHAALMESHLRRHYHALRQRLADAQGQVCDQLEHAGLKVFHRPGAGIYVWAGFDRKVDVWSIVRAASRQGILLAPGALFRVDQSDAPWFRFNVSRSHHAKLYRFLETIASAGSRPAGFGLQRV